MPLEEARIARIEAQLEIQQLPIRYALAVDQRDVDAWVNLFVPDISAGHLGTGREALREFITPQLRWFYRSIHMITGHRVILDPALQTARGHVYCRAEHEVGDRWIVMAIRYDDEYRRVDGEWLFQNRREWHWYATDVGEKPQQVGFDSWNTGKPPTIPSQRPGTWAGFWRDTPTGTITAHPVPGQTAEGTT